MALNVDNKKSALDDDAALYQKDTDRNEKKTYIGRFKELHGEERKQFFFDYMFKPLLIGSIIIGMLLYSIISSIVNRKTVTFKVAVVSGTYMDSEGMTASLDALAKEWGLDKHHVIEYSDTYRISQNTQNSAFLTHLEAGSIDAIIGTKDELSFYGEYLISFDDELSTNDKLNKDSFYSMTFEEHDLKDGTPIQKTEYRGVYLKDTCYGQYIKDEKLKDELILVMPFNGVSKDEHQYVVKFFNNLFGM